MNEPVALSDEQIDAFRKRFPITVDIPVAWGEMDAFQHVNNIVYFRYFESARIRCFEHIGYTELASQNGYGPILASTDCRFRLPLVYPDTVTSGTAVGDIGESDFIMHFAVLSHRNGKVAAEGQGRIVSFDYGAGRKIPLPDEIRVQLEKLRRCD
ncbi:MAG: acyl-CoA thioesterase [Gammaproteobacteria bacterium]